MSTTTAATPMEILEAVSPEGARTYMEHRAAIMDNPALSALPTRTKLLIGIGVASALQSERCTLMWTRQARAAQSPTPRSLAGARADGGERAQPGGRG